MDSGYIRITAIKELIEHGGDVSPKSRWRYDKAAEQIAALSSSILKTTISSHSSKFCSGYTSTMMNLGGKKIQGCVLG